MTTFTDPTADAAEVHESVRGLARATRNIQDPTIVCGVIGSLTASLASMAQVLQQLGVTHDGMSASGSQVPIGREGKAVAYQVSWELHRAAEMVNQVATTLERALQLEAAITYGVHVSTTPKSAPGHDHGLSL